MFNFKKREYSIKDEYASYLKSMGDSEIKTYIEERILGQMKWYNKKSCYFQNQFKLLTIISIILSAFIPLFTLLSSNNTFVWKIIITIASSIVTIITSILSLCKSKELWIEYRNTCETLKSLLHRYFVDSDIFSNKKGVEKNELLISQCEYIMTHEINNWVDLNNKKDKNNQSSISS